MILKKFKLKNRYLSNRIIASPMCQYSAVNGLPNEWHYMHYTKLISTGVSMLIFESTAINSNGRITHKDLVLSNNKQLNSKSFKITKKYTYRNTIITFWKERIFGDTLD